METGQWIVVALDTSTGVAGPFSDRDVAKTFAADAEGERLVVHVTRMYSPERGADEFAIRNRQWICPPTDDQDLCSDQHPARIMRWGPSGARNPWTGRENTYCAGRENTRGP